MGFKLSIVACLLIAIGSTILESWPVVALNVIWGIVSIMGLSSKKERFDKGIFVRSFLFSATVVGVYFLCAVNFSGAAWITTIIYIVGLIGFSLQLIERKEYLYWTIIGFLILVPHLIEYFQYSLLFREGVGAFIGTIGLWKINKSKIHKKDLKNTY